MEVLPLAVPHGATEVFGYRIGDVGYVTDAKRIPDEVILAAVKLTLANVIRDTATPHGLRHPRRSLAGRRD